MERAEAGTGRLELPMVGFASRPLQAGLDAHDCAASPPVNRLLGSWFPTHVARMLRTAWMGTRHSWGNSPYSLRQPGLLPLQLILHPV